jgi:hypothetical protein
MAQVQPSLAVPLQSRSTPSQRSRAAGVISPVQPPQAEPPGIAAQVCVPARHAPRASLPAGPV